MLPDKIDIQTLAYNNDGQGGLIETWETSYQDVPARLSNEPGRELLAAGRQYESAEYVLTVPWDQNLEETMRVIHSGVTYEVLGVNNGRSFATAKRALLKRIVD